MTELKDLRKLRVENGRYSLLLDPVEVSDLVEALQAEGVGEVRQWPGPITIQPKDRPEIGNDFPPGRYLVVPLPETTDE